MKGIFYAAAIFALLTVPAFAGGKTKRQHVTFANPITVGSTNFVRGDCNVSWEDTGDTVQVTLSQNDQSKSVTLPAKVVKGDHPYNTLTTKAVNGANILTEIEFDHFSLVFEGAEVASNTAP